VKVMSQMSASITPGSQRTGLFEVCATGADPGILARVGATFPIPTSPFLSLLWGYHGGGGDVKHCSLTPRRQFFSGFKLYFSLSVL